MTLPASGHDLDSQSEMAPFSQAWIGQSEMAVFLELFGLDVQLRTLSASKVGGHTQVVSSVQDCSLP